MVNQSPQHETDDTLKPFPTISIKPCATDISPTLDAHIPSRWDKNDSLPPAMEKKRTDKNGLFSQAIAQTSANILSLQRAKRRFGYYQNIPHRKMIRAQPKLFSDDPFDQVALISFGHFFGNDNSQTPFFFGFPANDKKPAPF